MKELQTKRKREQEEQSKQERPKETAPPKVRAAAGGFEFANIAERKEEQEASLNDSSKTICTAAISAGNADLPAIK